MPLMAYPRCPLLERVRHAEVAYPTDADGRPLPEPPPELDDERPPELPDQAGTFRAPE